MKRLLLIVGVLLTTNLNAYFSFDKLYFLPDDKKQVKAEVIKLINNSNNTIDIAMYNINYKKLIKALNKASKNGVKINIFYEKKEGNFHKKIKFFKTRSKLHTKIAIFDKKIVYYGSANWKKKSFKENYEVINITNEKQKVEKFNNFFIKLKENN